MTDREKVIDELNTDVLPFLQHHCDMQCDREKRWISKMIITVHDALALLKEQEAVEPVRGEDDDFYCGLCGKKIARAIKIYDGHSFVKTHPDHLKPECKCNFCKYCGRAVKWDEQY